MPALIKKTASTEDPAGATFFIDSFPRVLFLHPLHVQNSYLSSI